MKHPQPHTLTYKHSLAAYPIGFEGFVVSPHKICLQFNDVQLKTRVKDRDYSDLQLSGTGHSMAVDTQGTGINVLAVGVPLGLYPTLLNEILNAAEQHHKLVGKQDSLASFLREYAKEILNRFPSEEQENVKSS